MECERIIETALQLGQGRATVKQLTLATMQSNEGTGRVPSLIINR